MIKNFLSNNKKMSFNFGRRKRRSTRKHRGSRRRSTRRRRASKRTKRRRNLFGAFGSGAPNSLLEFQGPY